jgi:CRISPR system Cascade subunit CasB
MDHVHWESRFVAQLKKLVEDEDRATLARLRRGLGKPVGSAAERDGWVFAHLSEERSDRQVDAAALIASLFALWHQGQDSVADEPPKSLGSSFAKLREASRAAQDEAPESIEKRFVALLNCDSADLPGRLRHAASLLKARDVAVDWVQLLRDVLWWQSPKHLVQRRWARDFWIGRKVEAAAVPASSGSGTNP